MTDATSDHDAPEQVAAGGSEGSDETNRGRDDLESEYADPVAPVRQALYNQARDRLRAVDPTNPQIPSLHGPDWVPSNDDLKGMQDTLDRAVENQAANAAEHGYQNHVDEFPDIHSQTELQMRAQDVMRTGQMRVSTDGRAGFYQPSTNTLVIVNTIDPEQSTIFRPTTRSQYFQQLFQRKR